MPSPNRSALPVILMLIALALCLAIAVIAMTAALTDIIVDFRSKQIEEARAAIPITSCPPSGASQLDLPCRLPSDQSGPRSVSAGRVLWGDD